MNKSLRLLVALMLMESAFARDVGDAPWRSALYPADWKPGYTDAQGRFLHDFSYAGYHRGEQPIPDRKDPVLDVTKAPYQADKTGNKDATTAIQSALDDAEKMGGGVVFMPAGTYRIGPPENSDVALKIQGDHIVLRGEGPDKTFLYNDSNQMRSKRIITVKSKDAGTWLSGDANATPVTPEGAPGSVITKDLPLPATQIQVADTAPFAVGDLVVIRNDLTQHYIDLLGMNGKWTPAASPNRTLAYYRRVVSIDAAAHQLTVDVPLRGFLYTADNARVVKFPGRMISEVGLEDFSIGMKQHPGGGLDDDETKLTIPGTTSYEISWATALAIEYAENCWVRRVNSYCPPGNDPDVHILSNGIRLARGARLVTVEDCEWKFPQFKGGGGNGYLYTLASGDCLLRNCRAEAGRHNYSFGTMACSGNVIANFISKDSRLACDFHMFLSLANLLDNVTCDGNALEADYRPWGGKPVHGVTTTESVFWNTNGLRYPPEKAIYGGKEYTRKGPPYIVLSKQFGNGYVIGSRGPASGVVSENFVEGVGKGADLEPASLYQDQLKRRLPGAKP